LLENDINRHNTVPFFNLGVNSNVEVKQVRKLFWFKKGLAFIQPGGIIVLA